jgi:hypothetical protein
VKEFQMATKNNPGAYDCYENAKPDEPMFVLLARDEMAPHLVRVWALCRMGNFDAARLEVLKAAKIGEKKSTLAGAKLDEAMDCAKNMEAWLAAQTK